MRQACLFVVLFATLHSAAHARGASPKQRARVLFKQANALFKRGMYLDALKKYREARKLYPSHKIDLNIGSTLDSVGRRTEAAAYFERFLVQSADAPKPIIDAATKRLDELKEKLCSVKVASLVDGATLTVDGKAEGTTPMDLPVYMEPGKHVLELAHEDYVTIKKELELAAGQHETLDLPLKLPSDQPASQPAVTTPPPIPVDRGAEQERRSKTLWGYVFLGTGGALAVTAAVLYGVGASQGSSAHDEYTKATDPDEIERHYEDVESAKTKLVVGHVLMGTAAAAVGVSLYFLLTRPAVEQRGASPTVSLAPFPSGGLVQVGGRF